MDLYGCQPPPGLSPPSVSYPLPTISIHHHTTHLKWVFFCNLNYIAYTLFLCYNNTYMSHRNLPWSGVASPLVDYDVQVMPERYLESPGDGGDFYEGARRLTGALRALRPGVLMVIGKEFGDIEFQDPSLQADAYLIPEMAYGREESQRSVKFGQLVLHSKSQGERAELVAMKPMPPKIATREYHASEAISARLMDLYDRRTTFTNLGFYRDPISKNIASVTRYEHAVQSTDGTMWNREQMPSSDQVADVFRKAANSLSDLHGEALAAHGDAQPKNIASDSRGVRFIDLEDACDMKGKDGGLDILRARELITGDLNMFFKRLNGDYSDLVTQNFTERYLERLSESDVLPAFFHPTEKEILAIARQPQEAIPYLT